MTATLDRFRAIWVLDFEFTGGEGDNPSPVCLIAREWRSRQLIRRWRDELHSAPFPLDSHTLFVAYYASAEWSCFLALGWPLPPCCIDLYAEFRCFTNNRFTQGSSLLGALTYFGLPGITSNEKADMRTLILSGGPWTPEQQRGILGYCQTDVDATAALLTAMVKRKALDVSRALLRGRYTQAVATMETRGIPLDVETLARLREQGDAIQARLIEQVDQDYDVFEGGSFRLERFGRYLTRRGIPWPRLPSGALALDDDTFKEQARAYPELVPLRELRVSLGQLRLNRLAVGHDGRNRCLLSPFSSVTGRNQPSNARFIFGPATWMRSLIKPPPGYGVAYLDWGQQEFGIAAALSGDIRMMAAYRSGDPYLAFAQQAGAVPADATKLSHKAERDRFKACVLATQYGMGAEALALRINQPPIYARQLLELHRRTYAQFWRWSDAVENTALLKQHLWTVYGWRVHYGPGSIKINPRSIRNFPMQANGAEMLRLACILAMDAGIELCAPIHDAILIQAPLDVLDVRIADMQAIMREASEKVLPGFPLASDAVIVRHPGRYRDERGAAMWANVWALLCGEPEIRQAGCHSV
ncbi:MAG: DNA polymerase [Gammaproteobacteria bacterium]